MPRGHRKRGAIDCQIWFEDGASMRLTSRPDRVFTTEQILELMRNSIIKPLEAKSGNAPQSLEWLDDEEFNNRMNAYRMAPADNPRLVLECFTLVRSFIRDKTR